MANRLKGEASFTDEQLGKLTLRFDASVFLEMEDELDIGMMDMGAVGRKLGTTAQVLMFGLRHHQPDLEIDRVEAVDLLMANPDAAKALTAALEAALPKQADTEGNEPKPGKRAQAGTGK